MLIVGLILLVIGVIMALAWQRTAGIVLAIVGAVILLVALLGGGGDLELGLAAPLIARRFARLDL